MLFAASPQSSLLTISLQLQILLCLTSGGREIAHYYTRLVYILLLPLVCTISVDGNWIREPASILSSGCNAESQPNVDRLVSLTCRDWIHVRFYFRATATCISNMYIYFRSVLHQTSGVCNTPVFPAGRWLPNDVSDVVKLFS
jgi:hypothetical protein